MRKLASLVCAAGMAFAMNAPAQAGQVYLNGVYEFQTQMYNNINLDYTYGLQNTKNYYHNVGQYQSDPAKQQYHQKHYSFQQRLTLQASFVASPQLFAYWDGIVGYITWGGPSTGGPGNSVNPLLYGGALGSRSASIITRQAFLDWTIPDTQIKFRFGQQYFSLPHFSTGATPINNEFGSGITMTAPITDWVDVIAIWCRAQSGPRRGTHASFPTAFAADDVWDIFTIAPTFKFEGAKLMPYLGLSLFGKDSLASTVLYGPANAPYPFNVATPTSASVGDFALEPKLGEAWGFAQDGSGWFPLYSAGATANVLNGTRHQVGKATSIMAGIGGEYTALDPWTFAFDLAWGQTKTSHKEFNRAGWIASVKAAYKTQYGVPTVVAWYASGDDSNIFNGSERGVGGNGGRSDMTLWGQSTQGNLLHAYEGGILFGSTGFSLQWNKASFIDKMTHDLRIGFAQGTNAKEMAFYARRTYHNLESPGHAIGYLTKADRLISIDFDTRYEIYKQLDAVLECSYMIADIDGKVWGRRAYAGAELEEGGKAQFSNPWRVSFMLRYKF